MKLLYLALILILLGLYLLKPVVFATKEPVKPEMAKQYITEILKQSEFQTTREETHWRYIEGKESKSPTTNSISLWPLFLTSLAQLFELLLWILLGIGIILLILRAPRWLEQFQSHLTVQPTYTVEPRLLDKQVKRENWLPNLSHQAWALWQVGQAQAAISLLYRGALTVLTTRDGLPIQDSATENECLRLVQRKQSTELANYFSELTHIWQTLAYAQRLPTDTEAQYLCQEWQTHFRHEIS